AIAKVLSDWPTREQRRCGRQLLTIHADDLPVDIDDVIAESRRYMNEIERRLSPEPQSHIGHAQLGRWFTETARRLEERSAGGGSLAVSTSPAIENEARGLSYILRSVHTALFGPLPFLRPAAPLWADACH